MTEHISTAIAVYNFLQRLPANAGRGKSVAALICEGFGVQLDSPEFDIFVHAQRDNFLRLTKEIEFSNISENAKWLYVGNVKELSKVIYNPGLSQSDWPQRRKSLKDKIDSLIMLDHALDLGTELPPERIETIDQCIARLQEIYEDIDHSELDYRIKIALLPQLLNLVMLLKNYRVLGFNRAWEVASAAMMTAARELENVEEAPQQRLVKKLIGGLALVSAAIVSVDQATFSAENVVSRVSNWAQILSENAKEPPKLLEHKPKEKKRHQN